MNRIQSILRTIVLLAWGGLIPLTPSASAQTPFPGGATPYYWWGNDNTVLNLRLQIQQNYQRLYAILYRARFIRFSPTGYQDHMRQVNNYRQRIAVLEKQLRDYLAMHW
tara:strand:+ start:218 stop:544 length:327 start_codon:yes stop_codon:yes gene_type:complete